MSQNRPTPGWGKAIGILMIVFGSLGVFIQFYKIMLPALTNMGTKMMEFSPQAETVEQQRSLEMSRALMGEFWHMSPLQSNVLLWSGILGIIGCALYIVAGAKLLKAKPSNFFFARNMLIVFLGMNVVTTILLFTDSFSMILFGVVFYVIFGFIVDLVLVLILVNSDKTKYGIGIDPSAEVHTPYTRDTEII